MSFDLCGAITYVLEQPFIENGLDLYFFAIAVFFVSWIALKIFEKVVIRKLKGLSKKTKNEYDDVLMSILDSIGWPFYFVFSLYLAFHFIVLPEIVEKYFGYTLMIVVIYYAVRAVQRGLDFFSDKVVKRQKGADKDFDDHVFRMLTSITKWVLWLVALLVFLQNMGYEITTLVAGLGIGGIAIAFALQNVLSDIFSYFTISFDKPFKVGDYIVLGADSGTVKNIGIKSTRIQTLLGDELVVSNKELTETRVRNYKRMRKRRISFELGVTYDTPTKKLEKIPLLVKNVIGSIELSEYSRAHFKSFGDSSLVFEIVYFTKSRDYDVFMDVQQEINLGIKKAFEKERIEMAFPTQTIHLAR